MKCCQSCGYLSRQSFDACFTCPCYTNEDVRCECGNLRVVKTSWTSKNPGRRFATCNKAGKRGGCLYYKWLGKVVCDSSTSSLKYALDKKEKLEEEIDELTEMVYRIEIDNQELRRRNRKLKEAVTSSQLKLGWVLGFVVVLLLMQC